ncbi:hypothetical protein GC097_08370 [Paenibacillus sp. LMG 31457]|uniref:Uncharacterized protein n=1 Tax=Paenibacillus planticolens TaxID=2654976 RepID=A0ABX1ZK47_9BACL|nr:hypothetical protein [Paenibacillus planticolens]
MKYFEEAELLWKTYVPKQGQSETVQGELIRAIEKLRDEAQRNGNDNWDKCFVMFCDYLEITLCDSGVELTSRELLFLFIQVSARIA